MNPKDIAAEAEERCPLDLLEPAADEAIAFALANGRDKYGLRNFTDPDNRISYRVYLAAMRRHINALLRDENLAEDSGLHHLAHVGANVHVLMAAMEAGTLVDDRTPSREDEPPELSPEMARRADQTFARVFGA